VATVTFHNQPGTQAVLKKGIPLAGTSHVYTVTKILWPEAVENFIATQLVGDSLHICCGVSQLGDIRLDLDVRHKPTVIADAAKLPFKDGSFTTVLCDPPYSGKLQWNHDLLNEMVRVATNRVIFQHWFMPIRPDGRFKKWADAWELESVYVWQPRTYFGRVQVISILRKTEVISSKS
jgi:hypothetical protein